MSKAPFREQEAPSDELSRLAEAGRRRVQAEQAGESQRALSDAERQLRLAIAEVRGALPKQIARVVLGLLVATAIGMVIYTMSLPIADRRGTVGNLTGLSWFLALLGIVGYFLVPALATRSQVTAERAWVAALPFRVDGYFEALEAPPSLRCSLHVDLVFEALAVDADTLRGVVAAFDTAATVAAVGPSDASFDTGQIAGDTGILVNRSPVYRNHHVARNLRRLVSDLLLPLHRSSALSAVTIGRR